MTEGTRIRVFRVASANGLAALGGGAILGQAMGVLQKEPWLGGDSLLALLGGTTLSLTVIIGLRQWGRPVSPAWFSAGTGLTSLILMICLGPAVWVGAPKLRGAAAWLFFAVLVARWTSAFVGRALRADQVSAAQKLPTVELPYFVGVIAGLVIWKAVGTLGSVLLIDAVLQALAAVLDAATTRSPGASAPGVGDLPHRPAPIPFSTERYARVTIVVVAMTAGVQIVLMSGAHYLDSLSVPAGKALASDILVAIYVGAAVAAVFCGYLGVRYVEPRTKLASWTGGNLVAERLGRRSLPLLCVTAAATASAAGAIYCVMTMSVSPRGVVTMSIPTLGVLSLVAVAVALLGLITLPVCGRLGQLAMAADRPGMVALTYGMMGLAGAVTLFGLVHLTPLLGTGCPLTTSVCCLALTHGAMGWALRP